ncbi:MAG: hypothetical protein FJ398_24685 [Verrucomicrobia bacterium]|nr:hypothetical protein [Verrucomicrobiota bacterium]
MDAVEESIGAIPALDGIEEEIPTPSTPAVPLHRDDAIIQAFRTAARLTAQTLVLEIEGWAEQNPDHQAELDQELASAQQQLSDGDARALADDDEDAIQHYRKAWTHASTAGRYTTTAA